MNDGFDIIISRGGTASLIKNFSTIPVIEISLSFYDILRTLKLTSISDNECAIIGFENITKPAGVLCDMLGYKIKSITIHDARQAEAALYTLKSDGYKFVLCDVITETIARETGLNPVLITSGIESIQDAFNEAVKVCLFSESITEKYSILEEALQGQPSSTVILNENGDVIFSTYDSENISEMMSYLHEMVKDSKKFKDTKEFHMIENNLYSITVNKTFYQNSAIFLFYIEPNPIPSGITEMLLQSNAGKVELLAALPDDWDKGSYEGLVARGNFEVDCEWSDKTADYARITAKSGGTLVLDGIDVSRITDESGNAVSYTKDSDGNYVVETTKGQVLNVYASSYTGADKTPKPTPTSGAITTPNVTSTPVSTKTPTVKPTSTPDVTATVTPSSTPDTNVLLGDVNENNKVELTDASLLLRAALGIEELTDAQKLRADVNEDGQINLADVTLVLKYALGIIDSYK